MTMTIRTGRQDGRTVDRGIYQSSPRSAYERQTTTRVSELATNAERLQAVVERNGFRK